MMRNETGWFHNNKNLKFEKYKKNKIYSSDNLKFISYGDIEYSLDKNRKVLNISKNSEYGTIFIYQSNLKIGKYFLLIIFKARINQEQIIIF